MPKHIQLLDWEAEAAGGYVVEPLLVVRVEALVAETCGVGHGHLVGIEVGIVAPLGEPLGVVDCLHLDGGDVESRPEVEVVAGVEHVWGADHGVGGVEHIHSTPRFFISEVMSSTR